MANTSPGTYIQLRCWSVQSSPSKPSKRGLSTSCLGNFQDGAMNNNQTAKMSVLPILFSQSWEQWEGRRELVWIFSTL